MSDDILVTRDGSIATVTLNRPEKLNALTKAMWGRLADAVNDLSAEDTVRCVVLRGAGGKAFSPGNDISKFEEERGTADQAKAYAINLHGAFNALKNCRHPTIALIEGICVGGGLEIAALCDMRICGLSSRFGVPINRLGLVMAHEELEILLGLAGKTTALEILLEGRILDAETAVAKGLVNRVVNDDDVENEALETARRIADGAPLVARWHKKFIRRLHNSAPLTDEEIDEGYACYNTEDFEVGYRSFLEKTKPHFRGR